ncbi:MAG: universal stress protein [Pseudorhizobium sp.]
MTFKTVLAVVGSEDVHGDIAPAVQAASELGAHLIVIVAGIAVSPTIGDYPVGIGWIERRDEDLKTLKAVREQVIEYCRTQGVSCEVDLAYAERAFLEEILFQRALYCDVAIVGQGVIRSATLARSVVDAMVFHAHRPLALVPASGALTFRPKRVLLAWNSKLEAARAAREALDVLIAADQVHVTLIDPDGLYGRNGAEPGADVAAYLARHGVKVVVDQLPSAGRAVQTVLQQHARDIDADLMVMGAYGHSRMRQRIFGGVTASILEDAPLPVLLAR